MEESAPDTVCLTPVTPPQSIELKDFHDRLGASGHDRFAAVSSFIRGHWDGDTLDPRLVFTHPDIAEDSLKRYQDSLAEYRRPQLTQREEVGRSEPLGHKDSG